MSILHKKVWSKDEYQVFVNNIKLLANQRKMTIGDLQSKIGRKNIFRKDIYRPSEKLITIISDIFNVSKEWLVTYHPPSVQQQSQEQKKILGSNLRRLSDQLGTEDQHSRQGILELFKDRKTARSIILTMAEMEKNDPGILREIRGMIRMVKPDPTGLDNKTNPDEPDHTPKISQQMPKKTANSGNHK